VVSLRTLHRTAPVPSNQMALTLCRAAQGLQSAQTDREAAISAGQHGGNAHCVQVRLYDACLEAVCHQPWLCGLMCSLSRRSLAVSQAAVGLHQGGGDAQQEREEDQQPLGLCVGIAEHAAAAGLLCHHPQCPAGKQTPARVVRVASEPPVVRLAQQQAVDCWLKVDLCTAAPHRRRRTSGCGSKQT